jgi:hypothetical protein
VQPRFYWPMGASRCATRLANAQYKSDGGSGNSDHTSPLSYRFIWNFLVTNFFIEVLKFGLCIQCSFIASSNYLLTRHSRQVIIYQPILSARCAICSRIGPTLFESAIKQDKRTCNYRRGELNETADSLCSVKQTPIPVMHLGSNDNLKKTCKRKKFVDG